MISANVPLHFQGNGKTSNLYSKCKLFIGNKGETKLTTPRSKTTNPIFEEGFLLLAENPNEDKLIVQVKVDRWHLRGKVDI